MLQTAFSHCITSKMILTNFHEKILMFKGVRNSILVCDVIKKREKNIFGKHWQVANQQTQNDPLSRNLLVFLVY